MWLAAVREVGLEVAIPAVGRLNDLPGERLCLGDWGQEEIMA